MVLTWKQLSNGLKNDTKRREELEKNYGYIFTFGKMRLTNRLLENLFIYRDIPFFNSRVRDKMEYISEDEAIGKGNILKYNTPDKYFYSYPNAYELDFFIKNFSKYTTAHLKYCSEYNYSDTTPEIEDSEHYRKFIEDEIVTHIVMEIFGSDEDRKLYYDLLDHIKVIYRENYSNNVKGIKPFSVAINELRKNQNLRLTR